jgi:hypothetical protein
VRRRAVVALDHARSGRVARPPKPQTTFLRIGLGAK